MSSSAQVTLELTPQSPLDIIDVNERVSDQFGDPLSDYSKTLYYSYHTTAGYFDQNLCAQLGHSSEALRAFVETFLRLFPPKGAYRHDQLHLRHELNDEERKQEPLNAHSHLAFISSGLANCAVYPNRPRVPVYFVDLDGIWKDVKRRRLTTVVGFNQERVVERRRLSIPVSGHPVNSVNLKDSRLGFSDCLEELVDQLGIATGRIDIALAPEEQHAGLTVNEYETLLMKHDLAEVLGNPLGFMAEKGKHLLGDPRAIPAKAMDYAKYDLVRVINEVVDALGLGNSAFERLVNRFLAAPAGHFLGMKRSLSLLISDKDGDGKGSIVEGTYQSPILVQWEKARAQARHLDVSFVRFE